MEDGGITFLGEVVKMSNQNMPSNYKILVD